MEQSLPSIRISSPVCAGALRSDFFSLQRGAGCGGRGSGTRALSVFNGGGALASGTL